MWTLAGLAGSHGSSHFRLRSRPLPHVELAIVSSMGLEGLTPLGPIAWFGLVPLFVVLCLATLAVFGIRLSLVSGRRSARGERSVWLASA